SGSVLGSLIGAMIPFDMTGIDFSLTALFLTVFVEQWLSTKNHLAALTGVIASVVCLMMFGADNFLIPAMILITFALMMMRGKEGITNE
ncbi:MAG: branched-chain amino acid transporter AzlC, partial [Firmicutes bacterium]|nr:branched-chain amino acid transporter AzlC [Bacillota bacterium]